MEEQDPCQYLLCPGNRILSLVMSGLAEIQRAIEKLAPKERSGLRNWLDDQDIEEKKSPQSTPCRRG